LKRSFYIASLVSLQLLGQFVIQIVIVRILGVGLQTDVYIASQSVPILIGVIISSTIQSVWMPTFSNSSERSDFKHHVSVALSQILFLSAAIFFILWISVEQWTKLLYPGFSFEQSQLVQKYTLISLLASIFSNLSAILITALRAKGDFIKTESIVMFSVIITIPVIFYMLPLYGIEIILYIFLLL
jgi:Na+-driven multidrug efflux pump